MFEQTGWRYIKGVGEPMYHRKRGVSLSALDAADIGAMDARQVSEGFLGKTPRNPQTANSLTKRQASHVLGRHLNAYNDLLLDSLQPRSIIRG